MDRPRGSRCVRRVGDDQIAVVEMPVQPSSTNDEFVFSPHVVPPRPRSSSCTSRNVSTSARIIADREARPRYEPPPIDARAVPGALRRSGRSLDFIHQRPMKMAEETFDVRTVGVLCDERAIDRRQHERGKFIR